MKTKIVDRRPEIRLTTPLKVWKEETISKLERQVKAHERVLLVPAKTYSAYPAHSRPGRKLTEFRVRHDGHSQHYVAIAVPSDYSSTAGRKGGWNPAAGPKVCVPPGQRLDRHVSFKPNIYLEERADKLQVRFKGRWRTRNARIFGLVLIGIDNLDELDDPTKAGGIKPAPPPLIEDEASRCTEPCSIRFERRRWEKIARQHKGVHEKPSDFLRRLLWIGIQVTERETEVKNAID